MDEFKKYLQQHRDDMDQDEPGEAVWKNISKSGKPVPVKTSPVRKMIRYAAAAAVVAAIAFGAKNLLEKNLQGSSAELTFANANFPEQQQPPVVVDNALKTNADTAELAEAKITPSKKTDQRYALMNSFRENYTQLVNYQLSSIRSTAVYGEDPAYFNDFKTRLRQMDIDEVNIRNGIKKNGISNVLIERLINVYQQKLEVLKSLQSEINKMNTRVQENHPAVDSINKFYLNI